MFVHALSGNICEPAVFHQRIFICVREECFCRLVLCLSGLAVYDVKQWLTCGVLESYMKFQKSVRFSSIVSEHCGI